MGIMSGRNVAANLNNEKLSLNREKISKQYKVGKLKLSIRFKNADTGRFILLMPGNDLEGSFDVSIQYGKPFFKFHVYHYLFDNQIDFSAYSDQIEELLKQINRKLKL